jgi:hypothetical protein
MIPLDLTNVLLLFLIVMLCLYRSKQDRTTYYMLSNVNQTSNYGISLHY